MTEFKKGKYYCLIANKVHLYLNSVIFYVIQEKRNHIPIAQVCINEWHEDRVVSSVAYQKIPA